MVDPQPHRGSGTVRVVRVIARLNVGGPARHVCWLTAGLHDEGFDATLVAGTVPAGEDDMGGFAAALGVRPVVIPEMSREISVKDFVTVWKLYRLFARLRPDLVHTHTAKAGAVGRVAALLYRWLTPAAVIGRPRPCRTVHTYHGHIFHGYYGRLKTRMFLAIERLLARLATDRIVAISPQQFREIHETFGVGRAEQFAVIPLGIDLAPYGRPDDRRHALRKELGAADADLLVGIVGRLTEIKGHDLFLEAAARVAADADRRGGRRVRFLVIGDGHMRPALEARARELDLTRVVTFLGRRDDPEDFYPALDVVALTSRNEGTPLSVIEGMANGRPAVATDVGGVIDLLGPEDPAVPGGEGYTVRDRGLLVRPGDAAAFAAGLIRVLADDGLRSALGGRGHRFVHANYSTARLLSDVRCLYAGLLAPDAVNGPNNLDSEAPGFRHERRGELCES